MFKKRPNFCSKDFILQHFKHCPLCWRYTVVYRRTACARAEFSGCSSTTNAHSETGQMAVCCQNLPLGALSGRSAPSMLVGELFKKLCLFLNTGVDLSITPHEEQKKLLFSFRLHCKDFFILFF
jgi:hypothetical protein